MKKTTNLAIENNKFTNTDNFTNKLFPDKNISKENENDKKAKRKSLNSWDLVDKFQSSYPSLTYCTTNKCFLHYNEILEIPLWEILDQLKVIGLFIDWLKKTYPNDYRAFDIGRFEAQLIILLKNKNFSFPELQAKAYKNGFLLPFKNGVLNCNTMELLPHDKNHMSRHVLPIEYLTHTGTNLSNTFIGSFLIDISNNRSYNLNVIRAILNLILTNNLKYQVGLYIHGPGGTGKTTLTNLLQFILGPDASISSSLNSLNSRFGAAKLKDKLLLIINELPFLTNAESPILKSLIGGEIISVEEKYKPSTQLIPQVFVVVTSNSVWDIKNTSTGFTRRWIYLPFNFKPFTKKFDLFNFSSDFKASGILVKDLSLFIAWIISCPKEYIKILEQGGESITSKLSPNSLVKTNPLKVWVEECLTQDEGGKIPIGGKGSNKTTLYGSFVDWCSNYELEVGVVKPNQFSPLLLDLFSSLNWNVEKKRSSTGFILTGINFKSSTINLDSNCYEKQIFDFSIY